MLSIASLTPLNHFLSEVRGLLRVIEPSAAHPLDELLQRQGFQGLAGQTVPEMTDEVVAGITDRYIELYEHITGEKFVPAADGDVEKRIESSILSFLER